MDNFILNGNEAAKAIVLIYKKNFIFNNIALTEAMPFIQINDELLHLISENLVDMVICTEIATFEKCPIFEKIQPSFTDRDYVQRELDYEDSNRENSLNRCSIDTFPRPKT